MLRFFRNIRKQQATENKVVKYLRYAIGEILLVVIGILIALQINNWNQEQIRRTKEIEILKAFDKQLKDDLKEFEESLAMHKNSKSSMNIILNHLQNDLPNNDSLKYHFFATTNVWLTSGLNNGVFETLKSIGLDLISNQELRNDIVIFYDDSDEWIVSFETKYADIVFDASKNILNTRFRDFWNGDYTVVDNDFSGEMVPINYEKLKHDQEYLYFVRTLRNEMGWLIERPIKDAQRKTINLLKKIKTELKILEKPE
ncbi:MAG: hypothetical protein D8M58_04540 [Calditrichaeota bacterium]|nr:MAG: hypothetical protein DWQ03_02535 [Calditrichota bacterium]MBL1204639.1 hypothetical protein [Calditrichota bacterium]NOG44467.1 hypothetical protein [Calditrichota bacterium]